MTSAEPNYKNLSENCSARAVRNYSSAGDSPPRRINEIE